MSEREFKSLNFTSIKAKASGRTRTGIAAVFGNVDSVGDRIMPGAFARTLNNGGQKRTRFLWNHSWQHPPIASIKELREVGRDELPDEVLEKAPTATGGLLVTREYFKTELSDWILEAVDAGEINEMSFGFDIVKSAFVTEPVDEDGEKTVQIRELQELKLYDCSDVLWGANSATVAVKHMDMLALGVIASQLAMFAGELKAGRRQSELDPKLIEIIFNTAKGLGAADPGENADAGPEEKPEPAADGSTSLSPDWLELQKAKTQALSLATLT